MGYCRDDCQTEGYDGKSQTFLSTLIRLLPNGYPP